LSTKSIGELNNTRQGFSDIKKNAKSLDGGLAEETSPTEKKSYIKKQQSTRRGVLNQRERRNCRGTPNQENQSRLCDGEKTKS